MVTFLFETITDAQAMDWGGTDALFFGKQIVVEPCFSFRDRSAGNDLLGLGPDPVFMDEKERFGPPPRNLGPQGSQCSSRRINKMANHRR